jgi:LysM repeat protein
MSRIRLVLSAAVCVFIAAAVLLPAVPSQAQGGGQNLLTDGDFEAPPTWPMQDGIGEVQVAPGWRAWYLDQPMSYVQVPINCGESKQGYHCYWMRPEFRDNVAASFANRVHGGVRSQKYFSYGRMHEAGLYQQVGGVTPGSTLRFAIWIQAWQCFEIDKCGKNGIRSDQPADMHLRVGIDPTGGTDPFSPNIVWSPEREAFDRWVEFSVQAQARSSTVTVFTHSRPEWTWARTNNDVYLDDASLVVVGGPGYVPPAAPVSQPAATVAPAAPPTTAAPSAPASTPTGNERKYVVVAGDTLYAIAVRFNSTVTAIAQANQITNVDLIFTGQTLIIP